MARSACTLLEIVGRDGNVCANDSIDDTDNPATVWKVNAQTQD